ncbi:hypothetical protein F4780DRAFT_596692 [Xylariomycetidae sp. FL0641]|nr:hypothetical protein F4780DRAFT_596692 [Xylariomycetidae sp. FL0641]
MSSQQAANRAHGAQDTPDDDNTQHSRSAAYAAPLRYAKPRDLPSYPSVGLDQNGSAAGAAASLGWANKKSPEPWRPDSSASAATAALMAKDYKLGPAREPAASDHGTKAALLAAQSAKTTSTGKSASTEHGFSAATLAFKANRKAPQSSTTPSLDRQRSLHAAKGAMASRQRAMSSPAPREAYPDKVNAAANALSAATRAHNPTRSSVTVEDTGAVPYTNMAREIFTSRPPVKLESDEQKRTDELHASAVAMAQRIYTQQQKMFDAKKAREGSRSPHDHIEASSSYSDDLQPMHLTSLQDAAYKQAQARLAKMQQENTMNRDYQEYYGTKPPAHRFSVKGRLRRRATSDGAIMEDRQRSEQIRQQMSSFSNKLSKVDDQKRQQDQEALLAAAQRNVHERLKGMDEKIAAETGMISPATLTQWETKARAAAQRRSKERPEPPQGKIDIGAGRFMDQETIDAIAAQRVQPILDEINEKAAEEQARQTELRLEKEKKEEEEAREKARQKEVAEVNKKLKEQEKHEAKAKKMEEKAAKADQKHPSKGEKGKEVASQAKDEEDDEESHNYMVTTNSSGQPVHVPIPRYKPAQRRDSELDDPEEQPKSPGERGRVRSWFKRFSRHKSPDERSKGKLARRSFVGGVALRSMDGNQSSTSLGNRSSSMRAVALAGNHSSHKRALSEDPSMRGGNYDAVSSLSSDSDDEEHFRDEARDQLGKGLSPPRPIRDFSSSKSQSPVRETRFKEAL